MGLFDIFDNNSKKGKKTEETSYVNPLYSGKTQTQPLPTSLTTSTAAVATTPTNTTVAAGYSTFANSSINRLPNAQFPGQGSDDDVVSSSSNSSNGVVKADLPTLPGIVEEGRYPATKGGGTFVPPPAISTERDIRMTSAGKPSTVRTPKSTGRARTPTSVNSLEQEAGLRNKASLAIILLVVLVGDSSRGILFPTLWPYVKSLGGDKIVQGYTVGAFSFGRVIASPYLGHWSNVYGYRNVLAWCSVVVALGGLLYALASTIEMLVLAQTIMGVGSGTLGVTRSYVANKSTAKQRTYLLAYLTAVQYAGFTCMPMVGGVLYILVDTINWEWPLMGGFMTLRLNYLTAPAYFLLTLSMIACILLLTVFEDSIPASGKPMKRSTGGGSTPGGSTGSISGLTTPATTPGRDQMKRGFAAAAAGGAGKGTDNPALVLGPYCTPPPMLVRKTMERNDTTGSAGSNSSVVGFGKSNGHQLIKNKKSSSGGGGADGTANKKGSGGGGGGGGGVGGQPPTEETALIGLNRSDSVDDDVDGDDEKEGFAIGGDSERVEDGAEGYSGDDEEEEEEEEEEDGRWCSNFSLAIYGGYLLNVSTKGTIACFETLGAEYSMTHFGMTSAKAGMVFSTFGSIGVVALLSMRCLCHYFTDIQLVLGGVAIMILGCGVLTTDPMGPTGVPTFLFALFCMYAVGYPVGHTAVLGLFSKVVGARPQGALLGWFGSAGSIARITFPVAAGIISEEETTSVLMIVLMAVLGTAFIGLFLGRSTYEHFLHV